MQSRRFTILAELGRGGHGRVFRARDEQLGRTLAIKVFHDSHDEAGRAMSEARALCQLSHAGIVRVYDVSRIVISVGTQATITLSEDGSAQDETLTWAMLMEDLGDTDPLHHVLDHGPLAALQLIAELADALTHAHRCGVLHCDVKRSNVRIVDGHAKIFDFSLVSRRPGRPYGTPAYRAPEQTRGEEPTDRTDVYGLGQLLCELLQFETPEQASAKRGPHRSHRSQRLSWGHQSALESLIAQMLNPEPQQRPSLLEVAASCRQLTQRRSPLKSALQASAAVAALGTCMLLTGHFNHASGPSAADTFTVTVRAQVSNSDAMSARDVADACIVLDLGGDRRIATLDATGEATFKGVPAGFHNQKVPLYVQAPGFVTAAGVDRFNLSSEPLYIELKREAVPAPARLRVAIGLVHQGTKVLMVRRRHREGSLMWQFPAGIVKPQQEPEQRVLDETLKETRHQRQAAREDRRAYFS